MYTSHPSIQGIIYPCSNAFMSPCFPIAYPFSASIAGSDPFLYICYACIFEPSLCLYAYVNTEHCFPPLCPLRT